MPGARSPTIEEIQDLNRYVDKIAVYTALYGAEKARLVLGSDVNYITDQIKQINKELKN